MRNSNESYHAYVYNFQFEIENLNQTVDQFGDNIYNRYWVYGSDDDENIKDAIKSIVLNHISLNHDYLPDDVEYDTLDLANQIDILNQAVDDYFADGTIQLNRISLNSNLYPWLLDWYGWTDKATNESLNVEQNLATHVSDSYLTDQYLYYTTGIGYDTVDADLLGGDGSGVNTKAFKDFLNGNPNPQIKTIRQAWLTK